MQLAEKKLRKECSQKGLTGRHADHYVQVAMRKAAKRPAPKKGLPQHYEK